MKKQRVGGDNGWARWNALLSVAAAALEEEEQKEEGNLGGKKRRSPTMAIPEAGMHFEGIPSEKTLKMREYEEQPLPEAFKNKIRALGGSEPSTVLMFKKILTNTDVDSHHNRLLIPFKQVKNHSFLTQREIGLLENREKISALFIDPSCDEGGMNLTRWDMRKELKEGPKAKVSCNYSLLTNWNKVVRKNDLQAGDFVQLWGFRRGFDELGLALVRYHIQSSE